MRPRGQLQISLQLLYKQIGKPSAGEGLYQCIFTLMFPASYISTVYRTTANIQ
jgi:hypothetical protein